MTPLPIVPTDPSFPAESPAGLALTTHGLHDVKAVYNPQVSRAFMTCTNELFAYTMTRVRMFLVREVHPAGTFRVIVRFYALSQCRGSDDKGRGRGFVFGSSISVMNFGPRVILLTMGHEI